MKNSYDSSEGKKQKKNTDHQVFMAIHAWPHTFWFYFKTVFFFQVVYSEYLGQSKEEFLRENGPHMSLAAKVVLVLTEAAAGSPIVYLQVLFSEWLGKTMMTAVFRNSWDRLRPSLKVILGRGYSLHLYIYI